jgi:hypothetical protein
LELFGNQPGWPGSHQAVGLEQSNGAAWSWRGSGALASGTGVGMADSLPTRNEMPAAAATVGDERATAA